ncbi:MAG: sulfurtransferase TusA family protein, partial [Acetobacteraceae bacterium]|nr:sulfurtransferase TusA family protein [Acetobacteraceae bacterium]
MASETVLDVKGLACPLPVLRANKALRGLAAGDRLRVLATDPASASDMRAYCRTSGHALLSVSEKDGVLSFLIQKRVKQEAGAEDGGQDRGGQ